jgi:RimJ/RimL family protein N-acetyltransferase
MTTAAHEKTQTIERINTDRLLLRRLVASDYPAYHAMMSEPEVTQYLGKGETYNRTRAWREFAMLLGHWDIRGFGFYAVQLEDQDELIGRVGLFQPDGWPGMELGWLLGKKYWGKGYATEASQKVAQVAFKKLNVKRLYSYIHPDNEAAIRLAKRLGASFDRPVKIDGANVLQYQLQP